jgi:N-acetylneuraminic acid mutarotase
METTASIDAQSKSKQPSFLRGYVTMFSRISILFLALGGEVGVRRRRRATIVCIMLIVISGIHQLAAAEMEAGTWTRKADMPTARGKTGSAVVDGKIYVIGGIDRAIVAAVEEYDPATDTWTGCAPMRTKRVWLSAAAVDGIIYAVGGYDGSRDVPTVEAYDPATNKWIKKADMTTKRTGQAAAVVDGIIYVFGGCQGLLAVEAYDPATDTWIRKADMPTPRCYHAACVLDGRIYVSGGATLGRLAIESLIQKSVPTVEVYDPATDTWSPAFDMPRIRFGHTASVVDGKMYIIGGGGPAPSRSSAIVDVYDPATDTWTTAADRPTGIGDHTAVVVDGKIYTIGGAIGGVKLPGDFNLRASAVYEFAPSLSGRIAVTSPARKFLGTWGEVKSE